MPDALPVRVQRTRSSSEFYAASHSVGGFANGLAIAGDYLSAGTLLGVTAIIYTTGYDGLSYMTGGALFEVLFGIPYSWGVAVAGGLTMVYVSVGGNVLLGFMASVAFATLLAVVCGLVLAAAAALAHDLYGGILKRGRADDRTEVRASRSSVVALGATAVALGIRFEGQKRYDALLTLALLGKSGAGA